MSVQRTLGTLAVLAVVLAAWLFIVSDASQAAGAPLVEPSVRSGEPIELLRSDADGIAFAVELSDVEVEQKLVDGIAYDVVSVPGFDSRSEVGSPQVPGRRVLFGIPLGADYHLRVSVEESEIIPGRFRLSPAPTPLLDLDPDAALGPDAPVPGTAGWEYVEDERVYSTNALYPQAMARLAGSGFIRDQRYIAVQVNPVQVNPVSGEMILHNRFTVEIDFTYQGGPDLGVHQLDTSFEPVLSSSLLNYESAVNWRGKRSGAFLPGGLAETALDAGLPAFKIMVNEDGIYQVTAADLEAAGILVSAVPTTTYKLSYRGREVPIRVFEAADKSLDSFWFYGEQSRTKYTDTNVYWLTYDPAPLPGAEPGLRMPSRSVPPTSTVDISAYYSDTVRLEEDHLYRPYMPWAEDLDPDPWDHWFWDFTRYYWIDPGNPDNKQTLAFPAQLSGLSTTPYAATLVAFMSGLTASPSTPDHCTEFFVNGVSVGSHSWDGQYTDELVSFAFSSSYLLDGPNTVEAQVCASSALHDITNYDWFELDVRRSYQVEDDSLSFDVTEAGWQYRLDGFLTDAVEIFDLSGTYTVSHLVDAAVTPSGSSLYSAAFYDGEAKLGTRYLALTHDRLKSPLAIEEDIPSNLADPANQADYIVIAPKEFVADVQPLAVHRETQGLDVEVVELEPIFDEFNYGIYSPEAIRSFLAYAYHNWSGNAPSYVLLVGDGTYDYKGNLDEGNLNRLPPYLAWVDPWYGETAADNRYVTVSGDDPFPDMHIGRLPAETTAHLVTMVAKTIAYETNPAPRDWAERVLFVTDDPDSAGDFYAFSDDLVANYLPEPYVPIRAYYENTCLTGNSCKQVILDTLNSSGALLVNYIGHGGVTQWTGVEAVWKIDDLSSLVPTARLPVMLPMTCFEGAFHQDRAQDFEGSVLAEAMVRLDGRGAVASWSATGAGVAQGHDYLNKGFLQAVLFDGVRELGAAADAGKARMFATGYYTDLLETYHLLGDPALRLNALVDVAVGLAIDAPEVPAPGDVVTLTLTFTNAGPGVEVGVVLTDLLPSVLVSPTVVFSSSEVLAQLEGVTFAWTLDDLLPGAAGKIVLEATVDPHFPEPEVSFFNEARIAAQTYDQEPGNNIARARVNIKQVYLPLIFRGF